MTENRDSKRTEQGGGDARDGAPEKSSASGSDPDATTLGDSDDSDPSTDGEGQSGEEDQSEYGWYLVQSSIPKTVKGVDGVQDAINIAISEVGSATEEAKTYRTDIEVHEIPCTSESCDAKREAVLLVSDMAMVGLKVTTEVRAKSPEGSRRVTKRELGQFLDGLPIEPFNVVSVEGPGDA